MDRDDPPHDVSIADEWARRTIRTMQGRIESLERLGNVRHEQVLRIVGDSRNEMRIGFSLMGYDVQRAAAQRAAGMGGHVPADPVSEERPRPEGMRPKEASHPVLEQLAQTAETLQEAGEKLFEAAEAHTKPDSPAAQAVRQTDSERLRKFEAEQLGKRILSMRDTAYGKAIEVVTVLGLGWLGHWLWAIAHAPPPH